MTNTLRVLHVEDARDFRAVVARHLKAIEHHQFEIECVDGETEAVERCQSRSYDLALVDYELSEGDGLSCVGRLRKMDAYMPIIAISGRATDDVACELIRAGVDDYFDKSRLRREDFGRSVLSALERSKNWRDSRSHLMVGRKVVERRMSALRDAVNRFAEQELAKHIAALVESTHTAGCDLDMLHNIAGGLQEPGPDSELTAALWGPIWAEIARKQAKPVIKSA